MSLLTLTLKKLKKIEVKEWGTDEQPLEIFTKPLTLQESKKTLQNGKWW